MKKDEKRSVVNRVAEALRRDSIGLDEGVFLGSEDDLLERYDASRPTLRHAAAVVAQEQLLTIKRGVGGGYFTRRPDSRAVAHMAAMFLRTRNVSVKELIGAFTPIRVELAKLSATGKRTNKEFEHLREFVKREESADNDPITFRAFIKAEREFGNLLATLCGNNVLALIFDILLDLASMLDPKEDIFISRPKRVEKYREQRNKLARVILEGDEEMTLLEAKRLAELSTGWMIEDLSKQNYMS